VVADSFTVMAICAVDGDAYFGFRIVLLVCLRFGTVIWMNSAAVGPMGRADEVARA